MNICFGNSFMYVEGMELCRSCKLSVIVSDDYVFDHNLTTVLFSETIHHINAEVELLIRYN
jgi:hypothetical protein